MHKRMMINLVLVLFSQTSCSSNISRNAHPTNRAGAKSGSGAIRENADNASDVGGAATDTGLLRALDITESASVRLCQSQYADPTGHQGVSVALAQCLAQTPDNGTLRIPGGTYLLDQSVNWNRGIKIVGETPVIFHAASQAVHFIFPDLPNKVSFQNVTVDYSTAPGVIDMANYMLDDRLKGPGDHAPVALRDAVTDTTSTQAVDPRFPAGVFIVKGAHSDAFEFFNWDDRNVYLRHDVYGAGGPSYMPLSNAQNDPDHVTNGLVYAHRYVSAGSVVQNPHQINLYFNSAVAPRHPCSYATRKNIIKMDSVPAAALRPYKGGWADTTYKLRTRIAGHFMWWMGGDLGYQDVVRWIAAIKYTDPSVGYELFDWSSNRGLVHWGSYAPNGTALAEIWWNMASDAAGKPVQATAPLTAFTCLR